MSYLGGKQQPPLNRARHLHRYVPQQYLQGHYEKPPDAGGGGGPPTQPAGCYTTPLSAQARGYGPPPGMADGQSHQHLLHPAHYQQPVHDMAKPGVELPTVPGYSGPHQQQQQQHYQQHHQHQPPPQQQPALRSAPGAYSTAPHLLTGPRPPAPGAAYPPAHGMSVPPPPTVAAFSVSGGPPTGQGPAMMMFMPTGQVGRGSQEQSGGRQPPTAYMAPPPPAAAVYHHQQQYPQPPLPQSMYPPPPMDQQQQQQFQQQQASVQQPPRVWHRREAMQPPPPPPPSASHHTSHRIPIINPETHEEVALDPQPASLPAEGVWRPPLGNGVCPPAVGRRGRQHSSASFSELPDGRRGPAPRVRSSASYSEDGGAEWPAGAMSGVMPGTLPGVMPGAASGAVSGVMPPAVPGTVPGVMPGAAPGMLPGGVPGAVSSAVSGAMPGAVPGMASVTLPTAVPGSLSQTALPQQQQQRLRYPAAGGRNTLSPDVIRRQVMRHASPAQQSDWGGWAPPRLTPGLPDLVPPAEYRTPSVQSTEYAPPVPSSGYGQPLPNTDYGQPVQRSEYSPPVPSAEYGQLVSDTEYRQPAPGTEYLQPAPGTEYRQQVAPYGQRGDQSESVCTVDTSSVVSENIAAYIPTPRQRSAAVEIMKPSGMDESQAASPQPETRRGAGRLEEFNPVETKTDKTLDEVHPSVPAPGNVAETTSRLDKLALSPAEGSPADSTPEEPPPAAAAEAADPVALPPAEATENGAAGPAETGELGFESQEVRPAGDRAERETAREEAAEDEPPAAADQTGATDTPSPNTPTDTATKSAAEDTVPEGSPDTALESTAASALENTTARSGAIETDTALENIAAQSIPPSIATESVPVDLREKSTSADTSAQDTSSGSPPCGVTGETEMRSVTEDVIASSVSADAECLSKQDVAEQNSAEDSRLQSTPSDAVRQDSPAQGTPAVTPPLSTLTDTPLQGTAVDTPGEGISAYTQDTPGDTPADTILQDTSVDTVSQDTSADTPEGSTPDDTLAGSIPEDTPVQITPVETMQDTPEDTPARSTTEDTLAQSTPGDTPAQSTLSSGVLAAPPAGVTPAVPAQRHSSPPAVNGAATRPAPRQLPGSASGGLSTHPSSKKQYGRWELLALQNSPLSQRRPEALPDLPSVVRRVDPRAVAAGGAFKSRSIGPGEFASGFKPAVGGPQVKYRGRGPVPSRPQPPAPPPVRRIELGRSVKLRTTENAWKPTPAKPDNGDAAPDDDMQLLARLKGVLNKITPSNIEKHIENIRKLEFDTEERLRKMIDVLFDKAVTEPAYASQYAAVCLAMTRPPAGGEEEGKKVFRKLLLTQCQHEFEKDKSLELNLEERQREIEAQTDPAEKRAKQRALEEAQRQGRLRSNGNIRFIGELYKLSMLTDRIMRQCIQKLLKDRHEDSYECMCKLVTTIGQKLEAAERKHGNDFGKVFAEFERLSRSSSLSSRVRFMLRDLIELRANKWVPTRTAGQPRPMTIEEVHEQARLAEAKQQAALAQAEDRRRGERRRGGGDWNPPSRSSRLDASRVMTAVSAGSAQPPAQLKLGPGGAAGPSWGLGARRAPTQRRGDASRSAERAGSRQGSEERGPRLRGPADADADYLRRQARAIVGEFLDNGDEQSAIQDCESHLHATTLSDFITQSLEAFVDARSNLERSAAGRLHCLLLRRGLLTPPAYLSGVRALLDAAVDLATDVPAVWANLAQLLAPVLLAPEAGVALGALAQAAEGCVRDGGGVRLAVAVLGRVREEDGERAGSLVPVGFCWRRLIGDSEPLQVLREAGLDCLLPPGPVPLPSERAPASPGLRALLEAIRADGQLGRWLEVNCPQPEKRRHPQFVGDLLSAVCFDALVSEAGLLRVDRSRVERYAAVLGPELAETDRQLAALRSLGGLVRLLDCDPDILERLCELLRDLQLVGEPALRRWREAEPSAAPPLRFLQP